MDESLKCKLDKIRTKEYTFLIPFTVCKVQKPGKTRLEFRSTCLVSKSIKLSKGEITIKITVNHRERERQCWEGLRGKLLLLERIYVFS